MLEIKYLPTAKITVYENNSRTHSDHQINQVAASIEEFGFTNPILIDEDQQIIAGHGRDSVATRKVIYGTRRVGGTQVFLGTHGAENKFLWMAIALAGHEVSRIQEVYFGEDRVYYWDNGTYRKDTSAPYYDANDAELFNIYFYHGSDTQNAEAQLVNNFTDWTGLHRLQGIAYIVVQLKYDPNKYSNGVPNVTALVDGKEVYDPRDSITDFSSNSALCILDYLRDDEYGLGVDDAEIDFTSFEYAADLCDETVALDAGGSEPRYTLNGIVDTSLSPKQVIEEMLVSMGGKLVYAAGRFQIIGAEYRTPTITIDEDDIISDISVITKNSSRDLYNGVKGVFPSPDDLYQPVEYPTVESATYQSIDGLTRYTELNLPYTTSSATAQRLANILLNQSRQEITIQMRCKLNALQVTVGDNIYVNNTRLGFTNKVFEVGTVSISPEADGTIGVDIMAREISQSTYDWTATDEQALITNVAPYSDNFDVPAPTNLSVTSSLVTQPSNIQEVAWQITWTASDARNLLNYEVQWKKSSDTAYKSAYTTETAISGIGGVESGQLYTVRVRAINTNGAKSDFVTASHSMASGMTAITDTNTKTANGYLYYQVSTSSQPSTPSASSYNFSTGAFSSLSASWSIQTPELDGTDKDYWASSWTVVDEGGSQTITFSTPFKSISFDGLVTFTNLSNELADPNGTLITTIDGGKITTGTLDASVIYTGKLDLDDSTVDSGTSFTDAQWGNLTAAFALESANNSSGLYVKWTSTAGGQAIYGNAKGNNYGAAVVGVNESANPTSLGCWGGFFQTTANATYTRGLVGITNNTNFASAGGEFYAPYGGVGLACRRGRVELSPADTTEGAELRYAPASGSFQWITDVTGSNGFRIYYGSATAPSMILDTSANMTISGTYSPFTGSHLGLVTDSNLFEIGDIAVDSGGVYKEGVSQTITDVSASSTASSKGVIGVFSSAASEIVPFVESEQITVEDYNGNMVDSMSKRQFDARLSHFPESQVQDFIDAGKKLVSINAVGEGQINVCNEGGNIEVGDLIVTSSISGKGMKQSDDVVRSITVAKSRESITFTDASDIRQIACIYLCG